MWPTVTDRTAWSVCHTAEPTEMPFGLWAHGLFSLVVARAQEIVLH